MANIGTPTVILADIFIPYCFELVLPGESTFEQFVPDGNIICHHAY